MMKSGLTLRTGIQERGDFDRGFCRIDPSDLKNLGLTPGARLAVRGARTIYVQAQPAAMEDRNQEMILLDDLQLQNCGVQAGDRVQVMPAPDMFPLETLLLIAPQPLDARSGMARLSHIKRQLDGITAGFGDLLRVKMPDQYDLLLHVEATPRNTPGIIKNITQITINTRPGNPSILDHIGGLRREFFWLAERFNQLRQSSFAAPRGLLIQGVPGCGKTMLVEAVAQHCSASFHRINAAHLIANMETAKEVLKQTFLLATSQAPTVIMIDDIDLLLKDNNQEWPRTVLANQLFEQIDKLPQPSPVMVVGIAHHLEKVENPAHRRPGRFEHHLTIDLPDCENRHEILGLLARNFTCADQLDLHRLALLTHGYSAADLMAVWQEAALAAQRSERQRAVADANLSIKPPIAMHHLLAALTKVVPAPLPIPMLEISELYWQDIAGLDEIKQALRDAVEKPINYRSHDDTKGILPPHGILVTGAPGTGKTSIVKALAGATNAHFMHVHCNSILMNKTPCVLLKQIFIKARQAAPSIIFFDDFDHIIPSSDAHPGAAIHDIFNTFLNELDSTYDLIGLTIFAATSHADRIDQSLMRPGRFDYVVNIPLPDLLTRQKIFTYHAHKLPLAADVDFEELAAATQGFSGAEIRSICRRAGLLALRQSADQNDHKISVPVVNKDIFEQLLRGWQH